MKQHHMVLPFVLALIQDDKNEILLGQHPDLSRKPYPLRWDLPGGKLENFETPQECLRRELKEETGLELVDLELVDVFHHYGDDPECTNNLPSLGICYIGSVKGELTPTEMKEIRWVSIDEIKILKLTPWTAFFLKDLL